MKSKINFLNVIKLSLPKEKMILLTFSAITLISISLSVINGDLVDPLSNHNLGTANEANKTNSTSNEILGPCSVCRYSAKSFDNVSLN